MIYDICIIAVVALFAFLGAKRGLISTIYSLLSFIVSMIIMYLIRDTFIKAVAESSVGDMIRSFFASKYDGIIADSCTNAVIFVVSTLALYIVISLLLKMSKGIFDFFSSMPVIKQINKVSGFVLGIVLGLVFVIFATNILHAFPQTEEVVERSSIVEYFKDFVII